MNLDTEMYEYEKHPIYLNAQDILNIAFVLSENHDVSLELSESCVRNAIMLRLVEENYGTERTIG